MKNLIFISSIIYFSFSFFELNIQNEIIALDLLFIYSLVLLRNKPFHFVFIMFYGLFYIIPTSIKYFIYEEITPVGINVFSLSHSQQFRFVAIIYVFLFFFIFFYRLKLKHISTNSFSYINHFFNFNFSKKRYRFFLIISFLILAYSSLNLVVSILKYGYQEFHLAEGIEKRNFFFVLNQYLAMGLIFYGFKIKDKLAVYFFIFYNLIILFTGMRMPVMVNLLALLLFFRPKLITKTYFILPVMITTPIVLILVQSFRNKIPIDSSLFSNFTFVLYSLNQVNEILGYTSELLMASIKVLDANINIGYTNPFYDIIGLFDLLYQKISHSPNLSMLDRANSGSFSYQVFRYFLPNAFYYEGATGGGSSLADVYYYFGYLGLPFYSAISLFFCNVLSKISSSNNFLSIVFFFTTAPLLLRSFRDGAFSFILLSLMSIAAILFLLIALNRILSSPKNTDYR